MLTATKAEFDSMAVAAVPASTIKVPVNISLVANIVCQFPSHSSNELVGEYSTTPTPSPLSKINRTYRCVLVVIQTVVVITNCSITDL